MTERDVKLFDALHKEQKFESKLMKYIKDSEKLPSSIEKKAGLEIKKKKNNEDLLGKRNETEYVDSLTNEKHKKIKIDTKKEQNLKLSENQTRIDDFRISEIKKDYKIERLLNRSY